MTRAQSQLVLTSAARRRVFGEYQSTEPSRFLDEIPAELVERIAPGVRLAVPEHASPTATTSSAPTRTAARARGRGARNRRRPTPTRTRISRRPACVRACACGTRSSASARSSRVEEHNDDMKITVRFNAVGVKKLLAKYAKLEPA